MTGLQVALTPSRRDNLLARARPAPDRRSATSSAPRGALGLRTSPTTNDSTVFRMRLHIASAAAGPLAPYATPALRPRLHLPGTTGLRFALHGRQRQTRAEAIAARTWELTDFLLHVCRIRLEDQGQPVKVSMHTSCSARREMGLADVGPTLLSQLARVEVVEQARPAECCGFGGTFAVRHPEISAAMTQDKAQAMLEAGAERFVTTDCGCLMNIAGLADKQSLPLPGQHIVSFLWERVQTEDTPSQTGGCA